MRHTVAWASPALLALAGCVDVNPRMDYDRAATHIAEATGQTAVYRPGDEEIVEHKVDSLLADGVTASEAVQICLLNNPRLQAAFFDVGMARADLVQSGLLSNPTLGLSLRLPSGGGLANLEAGIAQNIADLWQLQPRKRAAERSLDRAILELARQAANLAAEAKQAYYAALGADQTHAIARENRKIAEQVLSLTEARKQAGAGSELDVNLTRGLVVEAELAVESTRLAAAEARRDLTGLLGLAADAATYDLVDSFPTPPIVQLDSETLFPMAREKRLDLRGAEQAVAAADARLQEQWRMIFPNVSLGVALERADRKSEPSRDWVADTARASIAAGALAPPDWEPDSGRMLDSRTILGPSLDATLPIFDQNQAQIAKAAFAHQQAIKTLDALERSLTREVRSAIDRTATAWKLVRLHSERFVPLAEKNLDLSRESYRAGKTPILTVLEAQRFFLTARRRYVATMQSAAATIPQLERVVGAPWAELTAIGHQPGAASAKSAATQPAE